MVKFAYLDKNKISSLPKSAGVYAFKEGTRFFYIGKASNIRERVKNHFAQPGFKDNLFVLEAKKIGYIKTDSEIEALILEAALIKSRQPKYNVLWKDDKNYFFVGITKEEFPTVFVTHQPMKQFNNLTTKQFNKIEYIGPFVDGGALKQTLKVLRKVFPYRSCGKISKRPCLWYQLGRCPAPCLLGSKVGQEIPKLKEKIKKESKLNVKNLIKVLEGKKLQVLRELKREMKEASKNQQFEKAAKLRDKIFALENILAHAQVFRRYQKPEMKKSWPEIEKKLKKILKARKKIKRIEGYDISNIQGERATGSMVVFTKGVPDKKEYRKFKIKISGKPNDTAMLKEVISRRLNHPEWEFPDLILIDGGRAQLNTAINVLNQHKSAPSVSISVLALAKKRNELYLKGEKKPILLKNLPPELSNLILRIRDEAHRFAITYHKGLRKRAFIN